MAKCTDKNKNGTACRNNGTPDTGGLCFRHWKERQGQKVDEVRVMFNKVYKNGAIGVTAGEFEKMTLKRGKVEQVLADDPHALVILQ